MAVEWRHLIFGDVDSADYGIYISGDGVYNAPERDVEFVSVPGRNGDIAMDNGRYNNITVTYPAGTFAKTQEEFREKLSDFRNAVLSQKGYQRLEDTYHPEEFRMAVYTAGLEVDPVAYQQAGKFELTFNCKPQRWLTVGALPIPVDSGDVLQNPTVFDSSPLLEVEGYGNISFNGYDINLRNALVGNIQLLPRKYRRDLGVTYDLSDTFYFDRGLLTTGDVITVDPIKFEYGYNFDEGLASSTSYEIYQESTVTPSVVVYSGYNYLLSCNLEIYLTTPSISFNALDVDDAPVTKMARVMVSCGMTTGVTKRVLMLFQVTCGYDYITISMVSSTTAGVSVYVYEYRTSPVTANSTLNLLGHPSYIDCETGEAYSILNNKTYSLNSYVTLGSDLPVLAPQSNKVTFDDTVTDLKIAPRWWKV